MNPTRRWRQSPPSIRARSRGARSRAFGTERVPEEDWDRVLPDQNPGDEAPDAAAARREQRRKIERALEALPEHHRRIVVLSDLEGLSYREIAETLEIPMGTVMSSLSRAREALRGALDSELKPSRIGARTDLREEEVDAVLV